MSEHTPGPWYEGPNYYPFFAIRSAVVGIRGKYTIATAVKHNDGYCERLGGHDCPSDDNELEANIRLITAAPELLEALENLLKHEGGNHGWWVAFARAAIAKARGNDG